ncbi:MAG TPA: transglycosylase SLT domain-containing protein [Gemmatimonadales bacterium]|nr:transglycosylase SLT domain-containing protein [Gemmatimonadales bacterium]
MRRPTGRRPARRERAERIIARGAVLLAGALLIGAIGGWGKRVRAADGTAAVDPDSRRVARQFVRLSDQVAAARGEAAVAQVQLERANAIISYSTKYQIPADLASAIYDIALSEGLDPALGFRLVKVESDFKRNARSPMAALGYTQLQLATARFYDATLSEERLLERDTNLRIGFRFLQDLLRQFDGDMNLALLAYNRGPGRVAGILAGGGNPKNGYDEAVLKGYRPPRTEAAASGTSGWR